MTARISNTLPSIQVAANDAGRGPGSAVPVRGRGSASPGGVLQDVVLGGAGRYLLVAGLQGEPFAVVDYPEVQVELGVVGEGVEDAFLPDHLRYREVVVLVPVAKDLLGGDEALPELGGPEAVRLDVGRERPVICNVGELYLDLRQHAVYGQALQEVAVLELVQEVAGRERRVDRYSAAELDNLRIVTMMSVIVSSALTPFVVWIGVSLGMQLVTRFFNGSGPLPAGLAVVGISIVPIALSAASGLVLTSVQATLGAQGAPRRRSDTWESCSCSPPSRGS